MQLHLAPLKNISCWAFRATVHGATDSYTEMISLKSLLAKNSSAWNSVDMYTIPSQRQWVQVLTNNLNAISKLPRLLSEFCARNPDRSFVYGVNINAGCPDPEVIAAGEGVALIKRTKRLKELIEAFLGPPDAHSYHISCKLRLGLNEKEMRYNKIRDFLEAIRTIDDQRLSAPIIHFKHAQQTSTEEPCWEILGDFLDACVPIIINGNIDSVNYLNQIQSKLGPTRKELWAKFVSGIMIGKAAMKNPDCFNEFLTHQETPKESSWQARFQNNFNKHPPQKRFVSSFNELFPFLFKKA